MTDFLTRHSKEPLDGKYRLIERLGAGGMGEVFKAEHIYLGATRVIKIVRPQISSSTEAHDRFVREARLATKVHHQNVATLHDFATLPDGSAYMVWEFIDGENLSQVLHKRGQLPPRLTIRLAIEALAGLDAIHRAGIVHRDISPENLMIARDEEGVEHVKIIDLGVAKMEEGDPGMTATGMFIGKIRYASPEHLGFLPEGERIDGRADLYSLAIVIYEMLTGRAPFEATSPHQYYIRFSREEALTKPDLTVIPGGPELQNVLGRALDRDRNRRFANAREFSEALQRAGAAIPDEAALKTMMLTDADETVRPGTQSPFATTVRTDYGNQAPAPTIAQQTPAPVPPPPVPVPAPVPETPVYTPPAHVTAIEKTTPSRSSFLPIALVAGVLLMIAFVGLLAYATRPLWWNMVSPANTSTTTQAAVIPPPQPTPTQTETAATRPQSQTTVDVTSSTTPLIVPTTTTAPPPTQTTQTTATVAEVKTKKTKTETQPPVTQTTATEEQEAPEPAPAAQIRTYMDGKGDSTWNSDALAYARRQLSGVKSVAVQGSASGDPELREQLEQLLARRGIAVSPSSDTVIKFHGKIERHSLGRKSRFADATISRNGRVVFHYQLPLEEYRVGDSPAEAFARVASDLFR